MGPPAATGLADIIAQTFSVANTEKQIEDALVSFDGYPQGYSEKMTMEPARGNS